MATEAFIGQLDIPVQPVKMDTLDKKIMYLLSLNGRLSHAAVAKHLSTSREVVSYRLQRLTELGVLHGFLTLTNTQALGKKAIMIGVKAHAAVRIQELATALHKLPEVTTIHHCGGIFDIIFTIQGKSDEECYARFHAILEKHSVNIKHFELFTKLESNFASLHLLLDDERERNRLYQIHEHKGNSFQADFRKKEKKMITDAHDEEILVILNHDARISLADLSAKTGLSLFQLQKRISSLIQGNIIQGFIPYFSLARCGFHLYYVFVTVQQHAEYKFREWVNQNPSIVWRTKLLGSFNYKLSVYVTNNNQLSDVLKEMYGHFGESILQTESLPVFASTKYASFLK